MIFFHLFSDNDDVKEVTFHISPASNRENAEFSDSLFQNETIRIIIAA